MPLDNSFSAPLVVFLDLKGLLEAFVVLLCECAVTDEGILPLPSPPVLNRNGIEASVNSFAVSLSQVIQGNYLFPEDVGLDNFLCARVLSLIGKLSEDLFLERTTSRASTFQSCRSSRLAF